MATTTSDDNPDSRMALGYGSAWHLLRYLGYHRARLSERVASALGATNISWLDFIPRESGRTYRTRTRILEVERSRLNFLDASDPLQKEYDTFFPPRSKQQQEWDAVGQATIEGQKEWVLVEAKAHCGEIVRKGTGAEGDSLKMIDASLTRTKIAMGIDKKCDWIGGYYQYANRIMTLHFLNSKGCKAHLVFLYFTGDDFTGKQCPSTSDAWKSTIDEVKTDLGLDRLQPGAYLMDRIHEVFLPVLPS
ncbi:MAG: hypothetical protein K8S99_17765 [Planctomycetes bacterium]|nr:hypothetical protein [Planctomycetota bacterium]